MHTQSSGKKNLGERKFRFAGDHGILGDALRDYESMCWGIQEAKGNPTTRRFFV